MPSKRTSEVVARTKVCEAASARRPGDAGDELVPDVELDEALVDAFVVDVVEASVEVGESAGAEHAVAMAASRASAAMIEERMMRPVLPGELRGYRCARSSRSRSAAATRPGRSSLTVASRSAPSTSEAVADRRTAAARPACFSPD